MVELDFRKCKNKDDVKKVFEEARKETLLDIDTIDMIEELFFEDEIKKES